MICTSDTGREWDVIDYFLGSIAHWLVISPLHPHSSQQIACNSSRTYLHIDKAPCVKPGSIDPMALSYIYIYWGVPPFRLPFRWGLF